MKKKIGKSGRSLITICPECGAEMIGLPWERRACPVCHIWSPANIFHPDAPEEIHEEARARARNFLRNRIEAQRNGELSIRENKEEQLTMSNVSNEMRKNEDPFRIDRPMSASSAAKILQDIELWKYEKENPKPDTKATAFGKALHCKLLEPDKFDSKFYIPDTAPINPKTGAEYGRTSKAYQQWFITVSQQAGNRSIVLPSEYPEILAMEKAYKPFIDNLVKLKGYELNCERKVEWIDEVTEHPCVGYMDAQISGIVLDLKTTTDMTENSLYRKCQESYFIQAAVYAEALRVIDGEEKPLVFLIFLRSQPPYSYRVVKIDKETIKLGLKEFRRAIRIYRECAKKKSFKISRVPTTWGYKPWKVREIEGD